MNFEVKSNLKRKIEDFPISKLYYPKVAVLEIKMHSLLPSSYNIGF